MRMRIIPGEVTGKDGDDYVFDDGRVAVSRYVNTCKHYNEAQVAAAARKILSDAIGAGQPADNLTLTKDKYKRFLGVL